MTLSTDTRIVLDLFSGAGGAAMGYRRAGFALVGVDINPQPRYPFTFYQGDAFEVGAELLKRYQFAAIHASPPCQAYSDLAFRTGRNYPDLIEQTRRFCQESGLPYIIENVDKAPLVNATLLCGAMFPGLRVYRHRLFEANFRIMAPEHPKHKALVYTKDKRKNHYGRMDEGMFFQVTGGGNAPHAMKLEAMGIDWPMNRKEVNEAVPPAYTQMIAAQIPVN